MMVTMRSSSSDVMSPALFHVSILHADQGLRYGDSYVPLIKVHIGLFANQVGVSTTDTLYLGQSVHYLLLAIDVGIEKAKDELEVRLLPGDERCS